VTVVSNGRQAVETAAQQDFDVILMDVQMPEMDGLEATRSIVAMESNVRPHVPIVAMTAHAMKGDRIHCENAGMDGYVSKPINLTDVLAEIARVKRMTGSSVPA
jgi:CheY-like chemotaxis protein